MANKVSQINRTNSLTDEVAARIKDSIINEITSRRCASH